MYRPMIFLLAALTLSGCMKVGPDYTRPASDFAVPLAYQGGQVSTQTYMPPDEWWKDFNDPALDAIVASVAINNPDIHQAAARVMEARASLNQTEANRYPEFNLDAETSRQQQPTIDPVTGGKKSDTANSFSLSLPASFELDLWGRLARASEASAAELMASEENRRTIVQSMIAEAVTRYLEIRSLEQQIGVNRQMVEAYQQNLKLVDNRYQKGLASVLDVRQASRILAQAESRLPSLVEVLGRTRHALAILQGAYPRSDGPRPAHLDTFSQLPPVPVGLPSELLNRRPDIRAAEARLQAASARIGVAKASRFPSITLTGTFGYASTALDTLFTPASQLWRIASQGLQPVFNAGRLSAGQRAAEARYQQEEAAYAKEVLNAFSEVEGALLTRQQQLERRDLLVKFREEARSTVEIANDRYTRGLTDYLNVLDAQQSLYQAELDLIDSERAIYTNRVGLYRALGGGWDHLFSAQEARG